MNPALDPQEIARRQREFAAIWGEDVPDTAIALDIVRAIAEEYAASDMQEWRRERTLTPHEARWGTACRALVDALEGQK